MFEDGPFASKILEEVVSRWKKNPTVSGQFRVPQRAMISTRMGKLQLQQSVSSLCRGSRWRGATIARGRDYPSFAGQRIFSWWAPPLRGTGGSEGVGEGAPIRLRHAAIRTLAFDPHEREFTYLHVENVWSNKRVCVSRHKLLAHCSLMGRMCSRRTVPPWLPHDDATERRTCLLAREHASKERPASSIVHWIVDDWKDSTRTENILLETRRFIDSFDIVEIFRMTEFYRSRNN